MRQRIASVLLLAVALAVPAPAPADGPPALQAIATIGGTLGKPKVHVITIDWVDAGKHGHVAFQVSSGTGQHLFEFRNSFEKPYGQVVKVASTDTHLSGVDFTDDSELAY